MTLFTDLCEKEVVHIATGTRLGTVDDLEFDEHTATIAALVIFGHSKGFGFMGREGDIRINWSDIDTVGDDIVLVRGDYERQIQINTKRRGIF
ncbi:MAG: YlmC/YmxH family sporulation protein [Oscillospiraceae bacterium]